MPHFVSVERTSQKCSLNWVIFVYLFHQPLGVGRDDF